MLMVSLKGLGWGSHVALGPQPVARAEAPHPEAAFLHLANPLHSVVGSTSSVFPVT